MGEPRKFEFKECLSPGPKDLHFSFDGKLYKQINGVVMVMAVYSTTKKIGQKVVHSNIEHFIISVLIIYLLYLIQQDI